MQVFRDMHIDLGGASLDVLIKAIEGVLSAPWSRRVEDENHLNKSPMDGNRWICFSFAGDDDAPEARLSLLDSSRFGLYVPNIGPEEYGQLSMTEYNHILMCFHDKVAAPAARAVGAAIRLSNDHKTASDFMSAEAVKKLASFSGSANKSTGSSHPYDFERWMAFIVLVHQEGTPLDETMLGRILQEEQGWSEDGAFRLSIQYQLIRDVLKYYDEHRE